MARKRPCRICRRWFRPDPRVGERQRACSRPECQRERRRRDQASWRARNPDYRTRRVLEERARQARKAEAASARSGTRGGAVVGRPEPQWMPRELGQVPWDFVQDEIGVQVTDGIGVVARLLVARVKDERRSKVFGSTGDPRRHRGRGAASQSGMVAGLGGPGGVVAPGGGGRGP